MVRDITLGQFFPGKSLMHRLDPRAKLLLVLGIIVFITGVVIAMFSKNIGGTSVKDIISGLMLGAGFAEMLVGIFVTASSLPKIK